MSNNTQRNRAHPALAVGAMCLLGISGAKAEIPISQVPLFVTDGATPQLMVNLPVDHQLYHRAYDDHTDLTGDGVPETTYEHGFDYYGYFDSDTCYEYDTGANRFVPAGSAANGYCDGAVSGDWSGNFLNWATMSRIDTVRGILYGGKRSLDEPGRTVLQRAYIPNDAHSFAKYYDGDDINRLTPFNPGSSGNLDSDGFDRGGITICNTTYVRATTNLRSQDVDTSEHPPLMRVAEGNYSLWAGNHRWQCQWSEDSSGRGNQFNDGNDNDPSLTGIPAHDFHPSRTNNGLGVGVRSGDFAVRVEVCNEDDGLEDNCRRYADDSYKPIGLLQEFGDNESILFGLMTGSYEKNLSGGTLRKNIGSFRDEINADGTFSGEPGIVTNLDAMRIFGYNHGDGLYHQSAGTDNCPWATDDFEEGDCSNWGNPMSEMFLEALRYFAGLQPTPAFEADDSGYLGGLTTAEWQDPFTQDNFCAPTNVLQFSPSSNSYEDQDTMTAGFEDIRQGSDGLSALTNRIGDAEGIHGNEWFIGQTDAIPPNVGEDFRFCDGKVVNSLADARGICPDEPRNMGSYQIAGMAFGAYVDGVRGDLPEIPRVQTQAVSLATPVPTITIPGTDASIIPACLNRRNPGNCSLVDFKIAETGPDYGRFYINWEDTEAGGDYDTDVWGILEYEVDAAAGTFDVTTQVGGFFADPPMAFGYITTGTDADGFHAHSGVDGVGYNDPTGVLDCDQQGGCSFGDSPTTVTYNIGGGSSANTLNDPLWYAAKYGGFNRASNNGMPTETAQWDATGDGNPDNYYFASDPAQLADDLREVFGQVADQVGSAAAVAANTAEVSDDTLLYQARFDTRDWSGDVVAFELDGQGAVTDPTTPAWRAAEGIPTPGNRVIYSIDPDDPGSPGRRIEDADDLTDDQIAHLAASGVLSGEAVDEEDLARYLLFGDSSHEQVNGGPFRDRPDTVLGTIVNSAPFVTRGGNFGYSVLGDDEASGTYRDFLDNTKANNADMLYVGANDGMLHAFDTATGEERFAFAPDGVFERLGEFARPNFSHRYFVDGQVRVADAVHDGAWSKVLAGATGAGARSVFALDVTDPAGFSADDVMWEIHGDDHSGLGHVLGNIDIVRMNNGDWAVVFGNGYNSDDQSSQLFIVPVDDPDNPIVLDTETGDTDNPNGLGGVSTVDANGNGIIDTVYAGDLHGNLWRFDVSDGSSGSWGVDLLFEARGPNGEVQPITAAPRVTPHSQTDIDMNVLFGTGRLFAQGDNVVPQDPDVQSFYALKDDGSGDLIDRGDLVQQEVVDQVINGNPNTRLMSDNPVPADRDGWYIDLIYQGNAEGERTVERAELVDNRVFFLTQIPEAEACAFGGRSWLMEMNAETGQRTPTELVDADADIGGIGFDQLATGLTSLRGDGSVTFYPSLADATIEDITVDAFGDARSGRMSWEELR